MAVITIVITALDYIVPALGAKKFGASRYGFWGAVIGMILGIIYAPPFGMIIGAFLGAIVGEMLKGKQTYEALKAGWGVFAGIMFGIIIKLIASGVTFYLWNYALSIMEASRVSVFIFLIPVLAILLGKVILNETITGFTFLGTALVLSGIYLMER